MLSATAPALGEEGQSLFGVTSASVTYGPYVRFELGRTNVDPSNAYWLPPNASDPRINFDSTVDNSGFGAAAIGFDWQTGWRADVSLFGTGTSDVSAPCASASDGSPCSDHADITSATVRSRGVMANVHYAPFEARGSNSIFQPFVSAGVGLSRNKMGEWTRSNPSKLSEPVRTFEGDTSTELAFSLGVGAALQVTRPGQWPIIVEAAWRYYDLGTVQGGAVPTSGSGGEPIEPFRLERRDQVVTIGLRIPLRRY